MPSTIPDWSSLVIPLDQLNVYGAVPPDAPPSRAPSLFPEHVTSVDDEVATSNVGSVTVTWSMAIFSFASITVTVYDPADKPVAVDEV